MKQILLLVALLVSQINVFAYVFFTDKDFAPCEEGDGAYYGYSLVCESGVGNCTDVEITSSIGKNNAPSGDIVIPASITVGEGESAVTYNITKIAASAFYDNTKITSIVIPEGVTEIGNSAFSGCTGLTSISIAMSVVTIGYDVFENCSSLKTLIIPDNVTTIGHNSFCGCKALEMIVFGEGITDIGTYDLLDNYNLKVIIIKATVAPTIAGAGTDGTGDTVGVDGTVYGTFQNIPEGCVICYPSESVGYETKEGEDGYNKQWSELVQNGNAITIEEWLKAQEEADNSVCIPYTDGSDGCEYATGDYTSISEITSSTEIVEVARYNIAGQKLNGPQKGVNIVVYSDGSTKKLIEK